MEQALFSPSNFNEKGTSNEGKKKYDVVGKGTAANITLSYQRAPLSELIPTLSAVEKY